MNHATKLALSAPVHSMLLYRRPLHPELFAMKGRKTLKLLPFSSQHPSGVLEVEAWLLPLGHMVRTQGKQHCLTELVTDRDGGLPTQGVLQSYATAGDNDYELVLEDAALLYNASTQTENLSPRLYASTLADQKALAAETGAMLHIWPLTSPSGDDAIGNPHAPHVHAPHAPHAPHAASSTSPASMCLSLLELAVYDDELHVSSTHMHPAQGLVLRTQSVLQRV